MADHKPQTPHDEGEAVEKQARNLPNDVNRPLDGIIENAREYDQGETRKIMRKIDIRLIPMLVVLYLFSFLDRGNSESPLSFLYVLVSRSQMCLT